MQKTTKSKDTKSKDTTESKNTTKSSEKQNCKQAHSHPHDPYRTALNTISTNSNQSCKASPHNQPTNQAVKHKHLLTQDTHYKHTTNTLQTHCKYTTSKKFTDYSTILGKIKPSNLKVNNHQQLSSHIIIANFVVISSCQLLVISLRL